MRQLGSRRTKKLVIPEEKQLPFLHALTWIAIDRSVYLNEILRCNETEDAIEREREALQEYANACDVILPITILDPGHIYVIEYKRGTTLRFVKRSSGAKKHAKEWPGIQTQELFRVLIECTLESWLKNKEALVHAHEDAILAYEARAHRRKQRLVNRKEPAHDDSERARPWRTYIFSDVSLSRDGIENLPIGGDGHTLLV